MRRMSFGKIGTADAFMGNTMPNTYSYSQAYIGQGPDQYNYHMANVPTNLKSNFYGEFGQ
jgi:hypothetical protein